MIAAYKADQETSLEGMSMEIKDPTDVEQRAELLQGAITSTHCEHCPMICQRPKRNVPGRMKM